MTEPDAERLMRTHRYAEAIGVFESRLADDPSDLGAMLRMGLCHLLNRSEPGRRRCHERRRGRNVCSPLLWRRVSGRGRGLT
jgi:hypothetical protein